VTLDDGLNMMSKFCWEHGSLPGKDFSAMTRGEILETLIDDKSNEVLQTISK